MSNFATKSYDGGSPYTQKIENGANGPIYVGRSDPGTATSTARWSIYKITYDGNGAATDIQWAKGTIAFDKVWDSRTTYTYS